MTDVQAAMGMAAMGETMARESLQTLAIPATASYAEIVAMLARSQARQVAMLFALHASSPLAQPALLDALRIRCQEMGKTILVIGGDERLRACAVSVGLTAATTLEDWRAAQSNIWTWDTSWNTALSPDQGAHTTHATGAPGSRRATSASADRQRAPLRLVEQDTERDQGTASDQRNLYDPWSADPPAYVSELVAEMTAMRHRQQGANPLAADQLHNQPAYYRTPITDPFTDSTEREALNNEIERYEAAITHKIRVTSAPALAVASQPSQPSHTSQPSQPGGTL
ncbi:MAG: hypothetical protein ABI068_00715 [Ktedonobacterales bacterium]